MENFELLIVEDDRDLQDLMVTLATELGLKTQIVSHLAHLKRVLPTTKFKGALVDLTLPDCQGEDVVSAIRASETNSEMMIYIMSAQNDVIDRAKEMRVTDYLKKPFELDQFFQILERIRKAP